MPHGFPKTPSLFSQELHPLNIPNHWIEMVAFIIAACHKISFNSLFWEGLICALGTPLPMVRNPSNSLCDLIWCQHRGSSVLPTALHALSPLGLPTTPTEVCLILCKVWGSISQQKDQGQGESWYSSPSCPGKFILVLLIVTAGKLCVLLSCSLYRLSTIMTLPVRTDTSCFKGISSVNIVALFSGDMWTKLTKLLFVHRVHPCPWLSDSEERSEIYSLPEMREHGTAQNWSCSPMNSAVCLCSS